MTSIPVLCGPAQLELQGRQMRAIHRLLMAISVLLAAMTNASLALAGAAPAHGQLFRDHRCPFSAHFAISDPPSMTTDNNASFAEQVGPGYQISMACIANLNSTVTPPLQGSALYDRLVGLARMVGILDAKVTVPVAPGPNCGLIEGRTVAVGNAIKARTQFCYGTSAYFIVETTSDGSPAAETAVSGTLASIRVD